MNTEISNTDLLLDYIHGDKFYEISDFIFSDSLKQSYDIINNRSGVIFCKAEFIKELFSQIEHSKNKYILITHNSDISINKEVFQNKPPCVKIWFAQNVAYEDPSLIPIPIGMERPKICTSIGMVKGDNSDTSILADNMCRTYHEKKVLMAFNANTNLKERQPVLDLFSKVPWVTYIKDRITFKDYISTLKDYRYVISPEGNGIDCHRTWEAIYMGVIPIVKRSVAMESFKDLPILIIDNYSCLTEDLLNRSYEDVFKKDREKATMSYWKRVILEKKNLLL